MSLGDAWDKISTQLSWSHKIQLYPNSKTLIFEESSWPFNTGKLHAEDVDIYILIEIRDR